MNASVSASAKRTLVSYFDFTYFLKFAALLLSLYYFNYFYIGLVDSKGRIYSAFFDYYLNYPNWIKSFLLHTSNGIIHAFGLDTYVEGLRKIIIPGRPSLILGMPCVGLNMLIFWTAFVNAHNHTWKKNLQWTLGGIAAICFINCLRIALMAFAIAGRWDVNRFINHHDMFKYVAYTLIIVMIFLYNRYFTLDKRRLA
jgi:exosortase/archaeosortase family protein